MNVINSKIDNLNIQSQDLKILNIKNSTIENINIHTTNEPQHVPRFINKLKNSLEYTSLFIEFLKICFLFNE